MFVQWNLFKSVLKHISKYRAARKFKNNYVLFIIVNRDFAAYVMKRDFISSLLFDSVLWINFVWPSDKIYVNKLNYCLKGSFYFGAKIFWVLFLPLWIKCWRILLLGGREQLYKLVSNIFLLFFWHYFCMFYWIYFVCMFAR